jgi:hypothetical protein
MTEREIDAVVAQVVAAVEAAVAVGKELSGEQMALMALRLAPDGDQEAILDAVEEALTERGANYLARAELLLRLPRSTQN